MPGASFGDEKAAARRLYPGMGEAVARRTVFRPADREDFGRVADRVAAGNISLLGDGAVFARLEQARLRNAIATGALITSGRHLQHGDTGQAGRNMEVFTNCATAAASFAAFYLLLNGAGVGRCYDDEMMAVDWAQAPRLLLHLPPSHADFPACGAEIAAMGPLFVTDPATAPAGTVCHRVADSREGWAKAVELLEAMTWRKERNGVLLLDLSEVRPAGRPIAGMQGRPASGPISLLRAFHRIAADVIAPARTGHLAERWEQAMRVDHHLSVEVQVGGARRAARMATKSWRDPGVLRFVRCKTEGGLWTANNSIMVDAEFWFRLESDDEDPLTAHARHVFDEATRCAYLNGEPGFINGDALEDFSTGSAWDKPVHADGRDVRSRRYQADEAAGLLGELSRRAARARFPVTTNPCGEVALHVTGGYCVIADFAPLLACPVPLETIVPGAVPSDLAAQWDARVADAVRLGVRFLIRANRMDALYGAEVARTNRIGIGPTGLHEWAWMRFGLAFDELVDPARSAPFWAILERLSDLAKEEANGYAAALGMARPMTVTVIKPAGTTSKLFGLTEGAHLPARRQYLRWVQFKGQRNGDGAWDRQADPLLIEYAARGYPVRGLASFPGMSIVGFPTVPLASRIGLDTRLVTAPEASPAAQFRWLRLLERHWIGATQGNQVSYTLKLSTDRVDLAAFREILRREQPSIRCCAIMPTRPDDELGYEYLPEQEVPAKEFAAIAARVNAAAETIDLADLQCANGICPI